MWRWKLNKLKTASKSFLSSLVPKFSPKPHLGIFHLMNKYLFFNHHVMDTNETWVETTGVESSGKTIQNPKNINVNEKRAANPHVWENKSIFGVFFPDKRHERNELIVSAVVKYFWASVTTFFAVYWYFAVRNASKHGKHLISSSLHHNVHTTFPLSTYILMDRYNTTQAFVWFNIHPVEVTQDSCWSRIQKHLFSAQSFIDLPLRRVLNSSRLQWTRLRL